MAWPEKFCAARVPNLCSMAATGDDDPEVGPVCDGCRRYLTRRRAVPRKPR